MNTHNSLLITFDCPPDTRTLIEEAAEGVLECHYLADHAGVRPEDLESDAALAMNLPQEVPPEALSQARWKLLQSVTAGVDHIPFEIIPPRVAVAGNSGAFAEPMAEHALALALALVKELRPRHEALAEGRFLQTEPVGSLHGKTLGVYGFGGIGKAVARLMRPFDVRVHAITRSGRTDACVEWIGTPDRLPELLQVADILLVSAPLCAETMGAIDGAALAQMKEDAILINLARGELIDEAALYEHLRTHPRFKAGIDAWWVEPFRHGRFELHYPFLSLPNLIGSPHDSAMVPGALERAIVKAVNNVKTFFNGDPVRGLARPPQG
jgi:glycerate dehydrogenase